MCFRITSASAPPPPSCAGMAPLIASDRGKGEVRALEQLLARGDLGLLARERKRRLHDRAEPTLPCRNRVERDDPERRKTRCRTFDRVRFRTHLDILRTH